VNEEDKLKDNLNVEDAVCKAAVDAGRYPKTLKCAITVRVGHENIVLNCIDLIWNYPNTVICADLREKTKICRWYK
jgi:hypothetical protein